MITTNDPSIAEKARSLKSLAFGSTDKFMHMDIGYNYRMTNLQAALGCAQLGKIDSIIENKRAIARFYTEQLKDVGLLQLPVEKAYAHNVYWMYHVALQGEASHRRTEVMQHLKGCGIETREGFIPYNLQDFALNKGWVKRDECPKANDYARRCFYLPSGPILASDDLAYIVASLKNRLNS